MKTMVIAVVVSLAVAIAAFLWWKFRNRQTRQPASNTSGAAESQPLMEMREELLRGPAAKFGIPPTPSGAWGCLMDMGNSRGFATLVSLADGTTSLYLSTGGGYIGGGGHEPVAAATKTFIQMAGSLTTKMTRTAKFPTPQQGRVRFYVLVNDGVFTVEADENDLGYGRHELSPLFHAGHEVITQFRMVSEKTH
ncbi:MAG: hypothetical protein LLG01_19810 [Planctomycetaceae bacterium]|nr:hypothetical protein [Planctomycetaceae bacterium]